MSTEVTSVTGVKAGVDLFEINDLADTGSKYHRFSDYLHLPKDSFSFFFFLQLGGTVLPRKKKQKRISPYIYIS